MTNDEALMTNDEEKPEAPSIEHAHERIPAKSENYETKPNQKCDDRLILPMWNGGFGDKKRTQMNPNKANLNPFQSHLNPI